MANGTAVALPSSGCLDLPGLPGRFKPWNMEQKIVFNYCTSSLFFAVGYEPRSCPQTAALDIYSMCRDMGFDFVPNYYAG